MTAVTTTDGRAICRETVGRYAVNSVPVVPVYLGLAQALIGFKEIHPAPERRSVPTIGETTFDPKKVTLFGVDVPP